MIEYHSKQGQLSRIFTWAIVTILTMGSLELVDLNSNYLHVSLLTEPQHAAFDGTVAPISYVPDWVKAGGDAAWKDFSEVQNKMPLPYYDAKELATPTADLVWGDPEDNKIRNAKITFSTPYMGSYKLDGKENTGSHLAVDIKTSYNTPVRAIMNGKVTKATQQSTGFGVHVVVEHTKVPDPDNSNKTTTLHSSYSHLKSLNVSDGDIVKKGQIIGYTGDTGTATVPHLHFQIDRDTADWHPYWPFTWKDVQNSDDCTNFWDCVDAGLGKEDAKKNTINPMLYVQNHANGKVTVEDSVESSTDKPVTVEDTKDSPVVSGDEFSVKFTTAKSYNVEDGKVVVVVRLYDKSGEIFKDNFDGYIKFSLKNNDSKFSESIFEANDFNSGKSKLTLTQLVAGETQLVADYAGEKFYSPVFELKAEAKANDSEPVANAEFFTDVAMDDPSYVAIKFLRDERIISGYEDGTFKPDKKVTRVEALKFISEALLSSDKKVFDPETLPFSDTAVGVWYSSYVATAAQNGLVNGYPDSTFRPAQDVNLAEFSKIALNAIDAKLPSSVKEDPYNDVSKDAWFAAFIDYAKEHNILDNKRSKIYPGDAMTRRDVAEFIFRILVLEDTGAFKYDERLLPDVDGLNL